MSNLADLAFLDAIAQAELVATKEVKPIELVEAAIERIEALNPELNAVVTPMFDLAREAATIEIPAGPFSGVPFLLKDLMAEYAGVRLTEGSAFLKNQMISAFQWRNTQRSHVPFSNTSPKPGIILLHTVWAALLDFCLQSISGIHFIHL
jgi:hypothetical protein